MSKAVTKEEEEIRAKAAPKAAPSVNIQGLGWYDVQFDDGSLDPAVPGKLRRLYGICASGQHLGCLLCCTIDDIWP